MFKKAIYIHPDKSVEDLTDIIEVSTEGVVYHIKKKTIIKVHYHKGTVYPFVRLRKKDYYIHRLILSTFCPVSDTYECCNHKDENKRNSVLSNLEWCCRYYNNTYNNKMSRTSTKGMYNHNTTPVYQFSLNGEYITKWAGVMEVERQTKINHSHIYDCCNGKRNKAGGYLWSFNPTLS